MKDFFRKLLSRKGIARAGFSLVEIMIVLAIIGTILGMIGSRIFKAQQRAQVKEAKIRMGTISEALSMYYNDCGQYPKALKGLIEADSDCKNWTEAYYKGELIDPWKTEFDYQLNGSEFTLKSFGADKREGGAGLNRDIVYGEENSGPAEKKE